jgi:hypothetical protein
LLHRLASGNKRKALQSNRMYAVELRRNIVNTRKVYRKERNIII